MDELISESPKKVLIVDDNQVNREILEARIQSMGLDPILAVDGEDALNTLQSSDIDLVLLDILMPKVSGEEVLKTIKQDPKLIDIPVIVISALDEIDRIGRCIELGAEDYLVKPPKSTLIKARINSCLEKKHLRDVENKLRRLLENNYLALKELEHYRDNLVHLIIHDLNNPLSIVKCMTSYLASLSEMEENPLNPYEQEFENLTQSIQDMEILIQNVLDVSRMEAKRMLLSTYEFPLSELLEELSKRFSSAKISHKTLHCEFQDELPSIDTDRNILFRILYNLLNNAFKYGKSGNPVIFKVHHSHNRISFEIRNEGVGIPTNVKDQIFEKFNRANKKKSSKIYGAGLGLYFCKLAVEELGGSITLNSEENRFTSFSFSIPY